MANEEDFQLRIHQLEKEVARLHSQIKKQRYGLVWLDVPEAFDEESENKIPILEEVKEKAIRSDDGKPTHILIEGDNYHALSCLNYTHRGKIDVIYIDPPYNTGSDGFTYKDKRILTEYPDGTPVPKEHPLRHSYWLSFMSKRLELAKNLLNDKGVIFISIDDNEQANLCMLCDKIFGENNHIATLPTIMNLKGNQDQYGFAGTHEYTIVYTKNKEKAKFGQFDIDETELEKWQEDNFGYFKKGATLKRTGEDAPRDQRPLSYFPILVKKSTHDVSFISEEEYKKIYDKKAKTFDDQWVDSLKSKYESLGYHFLLPYIDNVKASWRWGYQKVKEDKDEIIVIQNRSDFSLYKKQRPELDDLPSKKPKSIFYNAKYSSGNGTSLLEEIFGEKKFSNPKPIALIKDFLKIGTLKKSIILDFFAGSGTTMHAVMKLNEEDGSKRQCILVQQKEGDNNICENITYERNRRVMQGYTNAKGEQVAGLGNSMKYYKTSFVGKNTSNNATDADRVELSLKAGYLLALGENTLEEIKTHKSYQIFSDEKGHFTAVYFTGDLNDFHDFVEEIEKLQADASAKIVVYIFCWGSVDIYENEFDDMSGITLKSIPQPILDIYKSINA